MSRRRRKSNVFGIFFLVILVVVGFAAFARGADGLTSGGSGGGGSSLPANIKFYVNDVEYTISRGAAWSEVVKRYEGFTVDDAGKVLYSDTYLTDSDGYAVESSQPVVANEKYVFCCHLHMKSGATYETVTETYHRATGECDICGASGEFLTAHCFDGEVCTFCNFECDHTLGTMVDGRCRICNIEVILIYVGDTHYEYKIPTFYTWGDIVNKYSDFTCLSENSNVNYKGQILVDQDGNPLTPDQKPEAFGIYTYCAHAALTRQVYEDDYTAEGHKVFVSCGVCFYNYEEYEAHVYTNSYWCDTCDYICDHSKAYAAGLCPGCGWEMIQVFVLDNICTLTYRGGWPELVGKYDYLSYSDDGYVTCDGKVIVDASGSVQTQDTPVVADAMYVECPHKNIDDDTYQHVDETTHSVTGNCENGCMLDNYVMPHEYAGGVCDDCGYACPHDSSFANASCGYCGEKIIAVSINDDGTYQHYYVSSNYTWNSMIEKYEEFTAGETEGQVLYNGKIVADTSGNAVLATEKPQSMYVYQLLALMCETHTYGDDGICTNCKNCIHKQITDSTCDNCGASLGVIITFSGGAKSFFFEVGETWQDLADEYNEFSVNEATGRIKYNGNYVTIDGEYVLATDEVVSNSQFSV